MSARIKRKPAKYLEEGEIPAVQSPQVRTPTPTTTPTPTPPKLPSKRKLEAKEEQNKAAKKPFRSCEKQRCPAKLPICFTNATEKYVFFVFLCMCVMNSLHPEFYIHGD